MPNGCEIDVLNSPLESSSAAISVEAQVNDDDPLPGVVSHNTLLAPFALLAT